MAILSGGKSILPRGTEIKGEADSPLGKVINRQSGSRISPGGSRSTAHRENNPLVQLKIK